MDTYDHKALEQKWQQRWEASQIYRTAENSTKPKTFVLDMFPYPSGEGLHVGHPKGYIATDIYSRHMRMKGHEVLHPMGWDAFGLPAENYALKNKIHPRVAVEQNIANFKAQLAHIGFDYDWSREINTTDPRYYKWTQWIFLRLFKNGLAYQANEPINWCPSCMTGLANEDLDGTLCERCGSTVEKRRLPQWVLKITAYADRLLSDLDTLHWPEHIKEAQRNWIGKSSGAQIDFPLVGSDRKLRVFTTRPDTLFGATYMVLAPEHPLVDELSAKIENWDAVVAYRALAVAKTEIERTTDTKEKTGVRLEGVMAINPATKKEIPVFIADYVLAHYGEGAIMAVPAHDSRDNAFAKKFDLPITTVVDAKKYLIFDFDGVLGNTFEAAIAAHIAMGDSPDIESARKDILEYASKKPRHARGESLSQEGHEEELAWVRRYGSELAKEELGLFDAFIQEIEKLPNTQIAIVSSGSELYVKPAAERTRLAPSHILAYEDSPSKEEKIERIAEAWNVSVKDVYYFTDTKADVFELQGMLAPGHLIGCAWGYSGKEALESVLPRHLILENPTDIHTLFETLLESPGILVNSGDFTGMETEAAKSGIVAMVGGAFVSTYKIRDWVFSRQRYWGEPIPIVHCAEHGAVAVPEAQLPVMLPEVESYEPSGTGESPLALIEAWVHTTCPTCGGPAKRETNTMPQWAGSSWYYLRFMDANNDTALVGEDVERYWAPVDVYVGGDHAVRHLIYARFWHKFLYDLKVVSTEEPFKRLEFLGFILAEDGRKMSKRYGNVINPTDVIAQYGADAFRVYEMFMGPFENTTAWSTSSISGCARFIERVWRAQRLVGDTEMSALEVPLNQTIQKVSADIEAFKFNTAVSQLMILLNAVEAQGALSKAQWEVFLKLLAPFAPHIVEELWERLGNTESIHLAPWPIAEEGKLREETVTIGVQIDGKVRGTITLSPEATQEEAIAAAKGEGGVSKWLAEAEVAQVRYVPGRILSFVLRKEDRSVDNLTL